MFCHIWLIPNHFNWNSRTISIETETETGLYQSHLNLWPFVTFETKMWPTCLAKKAKKKQSVWPRSQIQVCDILWQSQMSHIVCDWYKPCFCFCLESGSERLLYICKYKYMYLYIYVYIYVYICVHTFVCIYVYT